MKDIKEFENKIICGDCLEIMKEMPNESIDLIFADPPFNKGKDYGNLVNDNREDYFEWCEKWIRLCFNKLKPTGSFYLMNNSKNIYKIATMMDKFGIFQNQIIWQKHMSPTPQKTRFPKNYQPILFYTKNKKGYYFNPESERVPHTYKPNKILPKRNSKGRRINDIWEDIVELTGGYLAPKEALLISGTKQRVCCQQTPEAILRRIILASSREDDVVLDPFLGVGTTAVICKELKRKYIGIDINAQYCKYSKERVNA